MSLSFPVRPFPLVDTHAHLNLEEFEADLDDAFARSRAGLFPTIRGRRIDDPVLRPFLAAFVCPGVDLDSSKKALELTRRFPFVYAAAGIHPNYATKIKSGDWNELERLALDAATPDGPLFGRLVAIGEIGLDRYWDDAPFDVQREIFLRQLELGRRANLPVIIHCRDANDDLEEILNDFYSPDAVSNSPNVPDRSNSAPASNLSNATAPGVVHSFSGTPEQAARWVELGFYLGFGGFVTYSNKKFAGIWEAARQTPADRLLLETDSPFLTPSPLRGKLERNEPLTTAFVAKRLAELRGVSTEEVALQTTRNAAQLFRLPTLAKVPENFEFNPDMPK